jgi:hypothetical protein
MMTPDPNYTYLRGATIVLHGSGWDLEDNGLNGGSLVWTSDVDGMLGVGRLTSINTLSAGVHTITLRARLDGMVSMDTATITIVPRAAGHRTETCQVTSASRARPLGAQDAVATVHRRPRRSSC